MGRFIFVFTALIVTVLVLSDGALLTAQPAQQWGALKGQIVWGGNNVPAVKWIDIPLGARPVVAKNPNFDAIKGQLKDDKLIVNANSRGIQSVFVYLLEQAGKPIAIHPQRKAVPQQNVIIDASNGSFEPRCVILREGQTLEIQNNGPGAVNTELSGDPKKILGAADCSRRTTKETNIRVSIHRNCRYCSNVISTAG